MSTSRSLTTDIVSSRLGLLLLATLLLSMSSARLFADASLQNDDFFVPDDLHFYNPLKHSDGQRKTISNKAGAMNNQALLESAEQIRTNTMSSSQRALNHQWLEQEHYNDNLTVGGRVFSKLVKAGFKTYWQLKGKDLSESRMMPNSNGDGKFTDDVDYKIRLSDDKFKLTVQYEF